MRCYPQKSVLPNDSIRFGEITFYPMTGMGNYNPKEIDKEFGTLIDLSFVTIRREP